VHCWLKLVTLCRKEGMLTLCENILRRLGAPLPPKCAAHALKSSFSVEKPNPKVVYSTYKYWWAKGEKQRALDELTYFINTSLKSIEDPHLASLKVYFISLEEKLKNLSYNPFFCAII
jgi:hypothetical protein